MGEPVGVAVVYTLVGTLADNKLVAALGHKIGSLGCAGKTVEVLGSRTSGFASEIVPGTGNSRNAEALVAVPPGPPC